MTRYSVLAAILLALASTAALAADDVPPLTVAVQFHGLGPGGALLPVCFSAPMPKGASNQTSAWFNGGPTGTFLAQAVRRPKTPLGARYDSYEIKALLPRADQEYLFEWSKEPLPEDRPIVVTLNDAEKVTLDAGLANLSFDKKHFDVFDTAGVPRRTLVPSYVSDLVNQQQGVELILTDKIRHVDFTLKPEPHPSCSVEETGPVEGTVSYKGAFASGPREPRITYQARVSLAANGVVSLDVRLDKETFDPKVMRATALKVTLPLLLEHAAALSFGGATPCANGRKYWTDRSRLAVAENGSYEFADADKSVLSGAQKVTWADYRDDQAGVGIAWGAKLWPVDMTVDYNEDLITLAVTPRATDDSPAEARICLLFYPPARGDALSGLAAAMDNPPAGTVNAEYLKAVSNGK